ncbi:MAG: ABC transporter permease subunit [Verrucomicrobiae bacterium]|nr:ABC transporter permease subunit [Verrucomicrobiae bacterium]
MSDLWRTGFGLQPFFAISETVWKRVLDPVMQMVLLCGSGVSFLLGLNMEGTEKDIRLGLALVHTFVCLVIILSGTTEIPRDLANRNVQFFLSKPLSRGGYLFGKFLGIFLFGAILFVAYVSSFFLGNFWNSSWDGKCFLICFLQLGLLLGTLSAILVGISVLVPEVAATVFGMSFYFASFMVFILPAMIKMFFPKLLQPVFAIGYFILPNWQHYLWSLDKVPLGSFFAVLILYNLSYCCACLLVADFCFRKRDLN